MSSNHIEDLFGKDPNEWVQPKPETTEENISLADWTDEALLSLCEAMGREITLRDLDESALAAVNQGKVTVETLSGRWGRAAEAA